jgi:hypothetical protein
MLTSQIILCFKSNNTLNLHITFVIMILNLNNINVFNVFLKYIAN